MPKCLHILSEKELEELCFYKHYSEKTTFEKFWCNTVAGWVEKYLIPDMFTPNFVTLAGHIPNLILLYVFVTRESLTLDGSALPDYRYFYWMAFAV